MFNLSCRVPSAYGRRGLWLMPWMPEAVSWSAEAVGVCCRTQVMPDLVGRDGSLRAADPVPDSLRIPAGDASGVSAETRHAIASDVSAETFLSCRVECYG
jgi:hypothetical protein